MLDFGQNYGNQDVGRHHGRNEQGFGVGNDRNQQYGNQGTFIVF